MAMTRALAGRVAIVTGAGRGVGRAISLALAHSGAAVALAARTQREIDDTASAIAAAGGAAVAVRTDVTQWPQVAALADRTEAELGPVDVLVNNAGGAAAIGPLWELAPEVWWADVALNLQGAVWGVRAVLPLMVARGRGRIINVGSMLGTRPDPYQSAYSTAKSGLLMFTESTALAARDHGVTVFAMSPGLVRTRAFENALTCDAGRRWLPELRAIPAERFSPPERAAELAVFLASGRGDGLTGRFVHVDDDEQRLAAEAATIIDEDRLALRLRR
jgi:NAD(P)-dependent dehydrogenase (short-subunit alcohol dehydrogenase family)